MTEQAKQILERSCTGSIERTGVPPNKYRMNLATLKTICHEAFGDGGMYEGFTSEEDWGV